MISHRVNALSLLVFVFTPIVLANPNDEKANSKQSAHQQWQQSVNAIKTKDAEFNAVIQLNPKAESAAKRLDNLDHQAIEPSKFWLGGSPILLKDNIDLVGMTTTAGSLALQNNVPMQSADLVRRLETHGAIILGKTNLSEWANFRSEQSSSGWSAVGGQTRNAIDKSRSPCGSSAGSAVAVAMGYVDVAIGTETNGSIVCPASVNGVVGFKPTQGLVSADGIVPLALTQDTAGPIASNITQASKTLAAMLDPEAQNAKEIANGLSKLMLAAPLKGQRIGVISNTQGYDVRRDEILQSAIDRLKAQGVEIVDELLLPSSDEFWSASYEVLLHEFQRDLNAYFSNRPYADPDNALKTMTLEKLIEFNRTHHEQELTHFDQSIFEKSQALELSQEEYNEKLLLIRKTTREDGLDKLFSEHNLNAVIGITVGPAWKIDLVNGDAFFGPSMSSFPAIGGHPHITVPGGQIGEMPVGLSFVGKRFKDHELAQLVYRFNQ